MPISESRRLCRNSVRHPATAGYEADHEVSMMVSRTILACAVLVVDGFRAFAQSGPDIATDQELLASYCLGAVQQFQATTPTTGYPDIDRQQQRWSTDRADRPGAYLRARGLTLGVRSPSATAAVMMTLKRGRDDATVCDKQIAQCVTKCNAETRPFNQELHLSCIKTCRDEEPLASRYRVAGIYICPVCRHKTPRNPWRHVASEIRPEFGRQKWLRRLLYARI
jgi:hypothetical protein